MNSCLFCRLLRKEIPAEVLYEDGDVLAFRDINPQAPVHAVVIPKKHVESVAALEFQDMPLVGALHKAFQALAKKFDPKNAGFRVVVNNGGDAGQTVFHIHYHFLAGRKLGWPPG